MYGHMAIFATRILYIILHTSSIKAVDTLVLCNIGVAMEHVSELRKQFESSSLFTYAASIYNQITTSAWCESDGVQAIILIALVADLRAHALTKKNAAPVGLLDLAMRQEAIRRLFSDFPEKH